MQGLEEGPLFDSYSYDGVNAVIGVGHWVQVANLGVSW